MPLIGQGSPGFGRGFFVYHWSFRDDANGSAQSAARWQARIELRCAIAHRRISRFPVWCWRTNPEW